MSKQDAPCIPHFHDLIASKPDTVIILEGSCTVHFDKGLGLASVGRKLAETFPNATFRSGNEEGADEALVAGVARVPGAKVELVMADDQFKPELAKTHALAFSADRSILAMLHPLGTRQTAQTTRGCASSRTS